MSSTGKKWQLSEFVVLVGWPSGVECPDDEAMIKSLAEAGCNTVIWDKGKLELCEKYGLSLMVDDATREAAGQLSQHPAMWGYSVQDEPGDAEFPALGEQVRAFHQADPGHPVYINLLSISAAEGAPAGVRLHTETSSGEEYLRSYMERVRPEVLSFDWYQWWWGREGHFTNLERFREAALAADVPLFCWIEVNADPYLDLDYGEKGGYPADNLVKLRQSVYTSLAYGVKGIEWFTGGIMFEPGSPNLNASGKDVAALNAELRHLGPVLVKLQSVDVWHTLPLPRDTRQLPADYWVHPKVVRWPHRAWNLVVGVFRHTEDERADYLLVANRELDQKREAALEFEPRVESVERLDKETGQWTPVPLSEEAEGQFATVALAAGDGELLRVVR